MRKWLCGLTVLTLAAALTPVALAQRPLDETRKAKPGGVVQISNVSGSVRVVAWDRAEVRLTGELERNVERVDFEVRDGRTSIRTVIPKRGGKKTGAFLTVELPASSRVEVNAVSASVEFKDSGPPEEGEALREAVYVKTVSGDIDVFAFAGTVELTSVSGEVSFAGTAETLDIETTSGDIKFTGAHSAEADTISGDIKCSRAASVELHSTSGDLTAMEIGHHAEGSSISGDIKVAVASIDKVALQTVSGDIELQGPLAPAGRIRAATQSGDIDLRLPADVSAEFGLHTKSGDIRTKFGIIGGSARGDLEFALGSGDGYVQLSTTSGDITIDKL